MPVYEMRFLIDTNIMPPEVANADDPEQAVLKYVAEDILAAARFTSLAAFHASRGSDVPADQKGVKQALLLRTVTGLMVAEGNLSIKKAPPGIKVDTSAQVKRSAAND